MRQDISLAIDLGVTVVFLLVVGFLMAGSRGRLTETKLILLGIFLGLASMFYYLADGGAEFHMQRGNVGMNGGMEMGISRFGLAGMLMKMGFILVLSGVAMMLMSHFQSSSTATRNSPFSPRKEGVHDDQN